MIVDNLKPIYKPPHYPRKNTFKNTVKKDKTYVVCQNKNCNPQALVTHVVCPVYRNANGWSTYACSHECYREIMLDKNNIIDYDLLQEERSGTPMEIKIMSPKYKVYRTVSKTEYKNGELLFIMDGNSNVEKEIISIYDDIKIVMNASTNEYREIFNIPDKPKEVKSEVFEKNKNKKVVDKED